MFKKIGGIHISEYEDHKHISDYKEILDYLTPEYIYVPLMESGSICEVRVDEGQHVNVGDVVAFRTGRFSLPIHSSVSGTVVSCNKKMWHSSGKLVDCIQIKNDFQETKSEANFSKKENITRDDIKNIAQEKGIVGLGGSGFPTFVKYNVKNDMDVVIINGAECEPFITADYRTMVENPKEVLKGLQYIMMAVGAPKGVIAIKNNKKEAIQSINNAITELYIKNISVFLLKDEYPAGYEKYIVQRVTNKTYKVLPAEAGAVVNNVSTAFALYEAIELGKPLIEKVVTFTGYGLNNPRNVRVKIGTNASEVIEKIGGYNTHFNEMYMITGGPMTGNTVAFENVCINRALGCILVLPKREQKQTEPCLGCGKGSAICPMNLTPTEIRRVFTIKDTKLLESLKPNKCIQCGLCSYVCPSRIDLTDAVGRAKAFVMKK